MRRFTWWDIHERVWRRARMLFVGSLLVVAIYAVGILAVLALPIAAVVTGLDDVRQWVGDRSVLEIVGAAVVVMAAVVVAILTLARLGRSWATLRCSSARAPEPEEARRVATSVSAFALAFGMPAPRVWIIDDPAPNALAFGRARAGNVCLTAGALDLEHRELEALCAFEVTALASRAYAYAMSTATLVLFGEWCTRVLWSLAAAMTLTVLVGMPFEVAGAYLVGTVVVVAVTRPLLVAADRCLVALFDDTSELVDLETIRHSALPGALARLLLALVEDPRRVMSRWEIDHLWFEREVDARDESDAVDASRARVWPLVRRLLTDGDRFSLRSHGGASSRRALLARARTAIDHAGGDAELARRLERASTVRVHQRR